MKITKKKITPEYFELVSSGRKKFELRLADFDVKEGDTLILQEYKDGKFTGRALEKKVGYILKFDLDKFGQRKQILEKGLYVIQFE